MAKVSALAMKSVSDDGMAADFVVLCVLQMTRTICRLLKEQEDYTYLIRLVPEGWNFCYMFVFSANWLTAKCEVFCLLDDSTDLIQTLQSVLFAKYCSYV